MKAAWIMILAALAAAMVPAQAGARNSVHRMRTPHVHAPHIRKPRASYRSVRVRRADGAVMTGYRDSLGTHLTGPDGRTIHCQRQIGAADIEVACR